MMVDDAEFQGGGRMNMDHKRMMMARENSTNMYMMLSRPHLPQDQLEWLVTFGIQEEHERRELLAELEGLYYLGKDPYAIPGYMLMLKAKILNNWKKYTDSLDSTSRVATSHLLVEMPRIDWAAYSSHFFLSPVVSTASSKLILVTGNLGFGKTNIATLYGEIFLDGMYDKDTGEQKGIVCVNYELFEDVPQVPSPDAKWNWVTKLSKLIELAVACKERGMLLLAILDESAISLGRQDATTKKMHNLNRFLKLLRKLGVVIVYITQLRGEIPLRLLSQYAMWIDKPAQRTARIQMRHGKYRIDTRVDEVPPTTIRYNTDDPGTFTIDIDMKVLMESLDDVKTAKDKFRLIPTLLKDSKL